MGIAIWLFASVAAFFVARMAPWRRRSSWGGEISVSIAAGLLLGTLATGLDFGGWSEPGWRAALFVFLGTLAAAGMFRLTIAAPPGGPA